MVALIIVLMILDWGWTLFQFFFPSRFEKIKNPALSKINESTKTVSYDELKTSFMTRNLFSKMPPKIETTVQSTLDAELARFRLIGVLSGQNKRAVFRDKNNQQTFFVGEANRVGNMTVKKIQEKSVIVAGGEQQKEIFVEK